MKTPPRAAPPIAPTPPKRTTKPARTRPRPGDRPPPESSTLRDRSAHRSGERIAAEVIRDGLAEGMGEDAVMAITSAEDETDAERGDGDPHQKVERATRDGSLFDELPDEDDDEEGEEGDEKDSGDDDAEERNQGEDETFADDEDSP